MTYTEARGKLHDYIDHAEKSKVMPIYTLLAGGMEQGGFEYDEAMLSMLEKTSEDAFSGKTKTLSVEESMKNIRQRRLTAN